MRERKIEREGATERGDRDTHREKSSEREIERERE